MEPFQRINHEIITQLKTSIPASLSSIVYKIPWLISIAFVGRIGSKELAAAALATSICNVTGLSLGSSLGLSSAVTTLTGQSKGEIQRRRRVLRDRVRKDHLSSSSFDSLTRTMNEEKKTDVENGTSSSPVKIDTSKDTKDVGYGSTTPLNGAYVEVDTEEEEEELYPMTPKTYFYRGVFVQLMLVLPVGIYWIHGIKPLLIYLGQEDSIAEMAQNYLRILTPGLWFYSINFTMTSWLQAIEMADVPMYGGLVGLIFHVPMNYFFIYTLGWGYRGAAISTSISQILQPAVNFVYLALIQSGKERIYFNTGADTLTTPISFSMDLYRAIFSYKGILQYLGLALPGVVLISEWWASEIAIFLAGHLPNPDVALSGMTIYQSINSSCFMLPVGVSVACSTRVSNLLGYGDASGAQLASKVSVFSAAFIGFVMGSVLFFTPHTYFPSLFTPDIDVIQETAKTIPMLSLYVFADGIQFTINGIVKGCGRQCIIMPIVLVAYWVVGLPLAYYVTFHWDHTPNFGLFGSVTGLVFGMTIGTWVHFLLLAIAVGLGINWNREVADAQERLQLERIKRGSKVNLYEENNISNLETSDAAVDETLPLTFKI